MRGRMVLRTIRLGGWDPSVLRELLLAALFLAGALAGHLYAGSCQSPRQKQRRQQKLPQHGRVPAAQPDCPQNHSPTHLPSPRQQPMRCGQVLEAAKASRILFSACVLYGFFIKQYNRFMGPHSAARRQTARKCLPINIEQFSGFRKGKSETLQYFVSYDKILCKHRYVNLWICTRFTPLGTPFSGTFSGCKSQHTPHVGRRADYGS